MIKLGGLLDFDHLYREGCFTNITSPCQISLWWQINLHFTEYVINLYCCLSWKIKNTTIQLSKERESYYKTSRTYEIYSFNKIFIKKTPDLFNENIHKKKVPYRTANHIDKVWLFLLSLNHVLGYFYPFQVILDWFKIILDHE